MCARHILRALRRPIAGKGVRASQPRAHVPPVSIGCLPGFRQAPHYRQMPGTPCRQRPIITAGTCARTVIGGHHRQCPWNALPSVMRLPMPAKACNHGRYMRPDDNKRHITGKPWNAPPSVLRLPMPAKAYNHGRYMRPECVRRTPPAIAMERITECNAPVGGGKLRAGAIMAPARGAIMPASVGKSQPKGCVRNGDDRLSPPAGFAASGRRRPDRNAFHGRFSLLCAYPGKGAYTGPPACFAKGVRRLYAIGHCPV
jgi:hypothetical protein